MDTASSESPPEPVEDGTGSRTTASPGRTSGSAQDSQASANRLLFSFTVTVVLLLLVGGSGYGASSFFASLKKKPSRVKPGERVVSVQVYNTESATVQELIRGFGTVRAMKKVTLSAQVAGEIVETIEPLKVGQAVSAVKYTTNSKGESQRREGDLVVQIDPQTYQERVDQARDRLREDQAELERLDQEAANLKRRLELQKKNVDVFRKEYDRIKNLLDQGIASPSDLTSAELDLSKYEDVKIQFETEYALIPFRKKQILARLQTHQNDLEIAQLDLKRTTVTSPVSGQFSEIFVERGQYVRVGDPLATVINFDQVEIPVGIPLHDYLKIISEIRNGNYPRAIIRTGSGASTTWEGIVTRTAPLADTQTRTVQVFVVVDNSENASPLLPGTFVSLSIEGPVYENIILIPREAVYHDSAFVVEKNKVVKRAIRQKSKIQSLSIVESGLKPGEKVILTNLGILDEGDAVSPDDQEILDLDTELRRLPFPFLKRLD